VTERDREQEPARARAAKRRRQRGGQVRAQLVGELRRYLPRLAQVDARVAGQVVLELVRMRARRSPRMPASPSAAESRVM